ncbi:MAG: class I SAM-dependent methyltransferase, partial [Mariprofundales bacterium]|nr:class I SAM-dependent methyltransferase [Mariprofundales bacterium]
MSSTGRSWAGEERFFSRSWTHIFYFWKLRQIMLGRTVFRLLRDLRDEHPLRVVDLGCGPGSNLFEVADQCASFAGVSWYGLDLNHEEVAAGADRSGWRVRERKVKAVHFLSGDLFHLPFADASVDILLSSEVVEHLPDPLPALQEMERVLKPGGHVMITTPNPQNLPE